MPQCRIEFAYAAEAPWTLKQGSDDRWSWPTSVGWLSFLRKSADEIVEPWHTSLLELCCEPRKWWNWWYSCVSESSYFFVLWYAVVFCYFLRVAGPAFQFTGNGFFSRKKCHGEYLNFLCVSFWYLMPCWKFMYLCCCAIYILSVNYKQTASWVQWSIDCQDWCYHVFVG